MMNKAQDCVGTSDHISNSMGNGSEYREWASFVQQKINVHQTFRLLMQVIMLNNVSNGVFMYLSIACKHFASVV